jgi:HD-like signal output (HDOD) protein
MTSAVLRAANSAASAPVNWVDSADRVIVRIGLDTTRRIVTGMVLVSSFSELQKSGLDIDHLWGYAMSFTDQEQRASSGGSGGFTAGLLHDIDRMAMVQGELELYAEVMRLVHGEGADTCEVEFQVLGYDHQESGA